MSSTPRLDRYKRLLAMVGGQAEPKARPTARAMTDDFPLPVRTFCNMLGITNDDFRALGLPSETINGKTIIRFRHFRAARRQLSKRMQHAVNPNLV